MRLLIAEDYQVLRESLTIGLKRQGFAVDATGDGAEALWFASHNDYDVMILDIMLPTMTGTEVLKAVRALGKDVPVLLLTAKDEPEDMVSGLDLGADDYVTKPFAMSVLLARLRSLTRRKNRASPIITVEDLTIDTTRRQVLRAGAEIVLTPREFALLEYLASRPGEVITRTELIEHIYAFDHDSSSNVIEALVVRLRRKLSVEGTVPIIHTRRGFGYTLGGRGDEA